MFPFRAKRKANFSALFILFTCFYICILFYLESEISRDHKPLYHSSQVIANNNHSTTLCHDPVRFMYQFYNIHVKELQAPLHNSMIVLHGFKNMSCPNQKIYKSEWSGIPMTNTDLCAQYDSILENSKTELCTGGHIVWKPHGGLLRDFTKPQMNKILSKYCNVYHKNDNVCDFNLLTYNMDILQQRIEFITKHLDCTNNNSQPNKTWVFKEFKHQGNGIHIYDNHQLIYSLIRPNQIEETKYYNKCINISSTVLPMLQTPEYFEINGFNYIKRAGEYNSYKVNYNNLIMQQFISNPLLIENRAFHIRTLHLVASTANPLIVLQYTQWQILRNPLKYNLSDSLTLRSNGHISDMGPGKIINKNGSIVVNKYRKAWGYNRFQHYLKENFNDPNLENKIQNDMQHIAKVIFQARKYYNRFRDSFNDNKRFDNVLRFDYACLDTVINDKFELKFLEINFLCGYYCAGKRVEFVENMGDDDQFCNGFATETSNILIEIYKKQKNGVDIKNINSLNKFKMVYIDK